jgi:hypothetical protein
VLSLSLGALASCSPSPSAAPDAAPRSTVPTSPAGRFALTTAFEFAVPAAAAPVIAELTAATDGPDDPSRYLVDRMIATLPDGTVHTLASQLAPLIAGYNNARLDAVAPRLIDGLVGIAGGIAGIASHLWLTETLEVSEDGRAVRTITGVRFAATTPTLAFADHGLLDVVTATHAALDGEGRLAFARHEHALPYGALLRLGLDRAVLPGVEPGAHDLAAALAALVDCDALGALVADRIGLGPAGLYAAACRAAMAAIASDLDGKLAAIDGAPLALELTGTADAVDLDGDGAIDELRDGRWSGTLAGQPLGATFTATRAP